MRMQVKKTAFVNQVKERGRNGCLECRRPRLGFLYVGRDGRVERRIPEKVGGESRYGGRKKKERKQYFPKVYVEIQSSMSNN